MLLKLWDWLFLRLPGHGRKPLQVHFIWTGSGEAPTVSGKVVWHFTNHWLPRKLGVTAITLGHNVLWRDVVRRASYWHELQHVAQYERVGLLRFWCRYLWEYARNRGYGDDHEEAYRSISFEADARRFDS